MSLQNTDVYIPQISVVIPVYNAEKYLGCCIESVLEQSFSDYELILIDDGSKDMSLTICHKYAMRDKRIKIISQKNSGVSVARNKGLECALGKFISFVDSDDYLEPQALEKLYKSVTKEPCDLVCGSFQRICANGASSPFIWSSRTLRSAKELADVCYKMNMSVVLGGVWGKLYRNTIIKKYQIRFPHDISVAEDNIFNINYYQIINNVILLEDIVYNYRENENSLTATVTPNTFNNLISVFEARKKYYSDFVSSFDKGVFLNQFITLFFWNVQELLRKNKSYIEKINILKEVFTNGQITTYIHSSQIRSDMTIVDVISLLALKTKSIMVIFMVASFLNWGSSNIYIRKIYNRIKDKARLEKKC